MKRTPVFYSKTILVIIGFILLAVSSQMVFASLFIDDWDSNGTNHTIRLISYNYYHWQIIAVSSILIFGVGYFFNQKANKIITWILAILSFLIVLFFTGFPLHLNGLVFESGYYLSVLGGLLIVLGTLISVMKKTNY